MSQFVPARRQGKAGHNTLLPMSNKLHQSKFFVPLNYF